MKYCRHCGNQLVDDAVVCPQCGCPTELYYAQQQYNPPYAPKPPKTRVYSPLSIIGFVFAFIQPIVGLICSIIAYKSAATENNERCKNFAKAGIIVSAVFLGLKIIYNVVFEILTELDIISNGYLWFYRWFLW